MPLEEKILFTQRRIREFHEQLFGSVYVSFSGGKDSTVLLHLVRELYPDTPAVFIDTGLEYPEVVEFVRTIPNVTIIKPKKPFNVVLKEYGYPVVSKETSQKINEIRSTLSDKLKDKRMNGDENGHGKISEKWKFLIDAPFKISDRCCHVMKKRPVKLYEKETGRHPYVGTMAADSSLRTMNYLRHSCNSFDSKRPMSLPLSIWTEENIWEYIRSRNLPYSTIYDKGYHNTGCVFCLFGIHLTKNPTKFELLAQTHPQLHKYCMEQLGLKEIIQYIESKGKV